MSDSGDLTQRLREFSDWWTDRSYEFGLLTEAADEIERLDTANTLLIQRHDLARAEAERLRALLEAKADDYSRLQQALRGLLRLVGHHTNSLAVLAARAVLDEGNQQ